MIMSHNSKIFDTEPHFTIDPATRNILNATSSNNILVQNDHNSERFSFEMPRYVDGHDMLESTVIRIHYRNLATNGLSRANGVYTPDDMALLEEDENTIVFTWLLSSGTTKHIGSLQFSIQFLCLDGETVEYSWNTGVYANIKVIESINNTEEVVVADPDAIETLKNELRAELDRSIMPTIREVTLYADKWVGNASLYSQVVEIEGVTENSQVDLTPSVEQLAIFYDKDIAFVTVNEEGVVTVYVIGQKPQNDYTIQVTITEVSV